MCLSNTLRNSFRTPHIGLSCLRWASLPASFSTTKYYSSSHCSQNWMFGHWTCLLEAGLQPSFIHISNYVCFRARMFRHWTCHCSGLVVVKLGPWPSPLLIANDCQLLLLLALDDEATDLSVTNSTTNQVLLDLEFGKMSNWSPPGIGPFILELGQSAILMRTHDCSQTWMIQHRICHFGDGPSAQLHPC